jgi:hypothetical protein
MNGRIIVIDEKTGMVKVEYSDGSVEVFHYGTDLTRNPGQGFDIKQNMVLSRDLKVGSRVKRGDVLAYNDKFFKQDPVSGHVDFMLGVTGRVAVVENDGTIEDSSIITKALADRLQFESVHARDVVINAGTTIHDFVDIGNHVSSTDALMIFDEADMPTDFKYSDNKELMDMLGDLNRATPRAKFDGEIMRIEAYHSVPYTEMSKSVKAMVQHVRESTNAQASFAEGSSNSGEFPKHDTLPKDSKIGITALDNDTVMFRFYISHTSGMRGGSKLIYSSSLKSVVANVIQDTPIGADDNEPVDALTSWRGLNNRLVFGVVLTGLASRIVNDLEKRIVELAK